MFRSLWVLKVPFEKSKRKTTYIIVNTNKKKDIKSDNTILSKM